MYQSGKEKCFRFPNNLWRKSIESGIPLGPRKLRYKVTDKILQVGTFSKPDTIIHSAGIFFFTLSLHELFFSPTFPCIFLYYLSPLPITLILVMARPL